MKAFFSFLAFCLISFTVNSQYYPPPACIGYDDFTVTICPPDSIPSYSGGLLRYNLYLDEDYVDFIPAIDPADTVLYAFDPLPDPGQHDFCAKAVYMNWISEPTCDSGLIYYGMPVPFTEDWSSGSFEVNSWQAEGDRWDISADTGREAPSAVYHGQSGLTDYAEALTSYVFLGDSLHVSSLYVEFDLKLNSLNSTGDEKLLPQYWDWTNRAWYGNMNIEPSNENGSFDWKHYTMRLNTVTGRLFRVRFLAEGANSDDIEGWYIDNVHVYRACMAPDDLQAQMNWAGQIELHWSTPTCGNPYPYELSYCSPDLYVSIGTGTETVFDVAARWTPAMLTNYSNRNINTINFFPAESNAVYSVRIWQGDSANLVLEELVIEPVIGEWNHVPLDSPYPIDISQMLWIGYHVETETGYPAGVDGGPADDGYGNMLYWNGEWSTLLEINPELDYNWMISAFVSPPNPVYCGNRIYRKVNQGQYGLIADIPMDYYYLDETADPDSLNCYLVSDVIAKNGDTCESGFTNESCVVPTGLADNPVSEEILIYPNPTEGILYIQSSSVIDRTEVYDLTDRLVFEAVFSSSKEIIDLSSLSPGVYIVRIFSGNKCIVRKILLV